MNLTSKDNIGHTLESGVSFLFKTYARLRHIAICSSCAEWLANGYTESGEYLIKPEGAEEPILVKCDMVTQGGGWTLLNPELASISHGNWQNLDTKYNTIRGRTKQEDCSQYRDYDLKVYNIGMDWQRMRMDLHRIYGGVKQCSRMYDFDSRAFPANTSSFRVEANGDETSYGLCQWNDGSWAYGTSTRNGRDAEWRMYGDRLSPEKNYMHYVTTCEPYWEAYYDYGMDVWVK